jgi:uncharacterized protein
MQNDSQIIDTLDKYNFWRDAERIEYGFLRKTYLHSLESFLGNNLIKVILGQRRAGKSRLMRMLIEYLIVQYQVPPINILYINKELYDFDFIRDAATLLNTFKLYQKTMNPVGKIYLLIDEIQEVTDWEKAINSLSQDYRLEIEVFITGSNANLLSSELSTYLSGRYLSLMVYPFSYTEYLQIFSLARGKESVLNYLEQGGLPELYQLTHIESKQNYIKSLLDSIVLRDIVQRHHIRDTYLLEKVIHFAIDSIGSMLSVSSIIKSLSSNGYSSNAETIGNYLDFCKNALFLHECQRYDLRGKQILLGERKYYLNDLAFKNFYHSKFETKISRLLENAVYLSLLRQGYQVYVGRYYDKEVDFVAERANEKIYIQVAYLLSDETVIAREVASLAGIRDNHPKWIVSLDDVAHGNIDGILHKQIWDFL